MGASLVAQLVKNLPEVGDLGLIPVSGRSPGEGNGNPLQYFCLGNLGNRGAWWATVHGVARVKHGLTIELTTTTGYNSLCHMVGYCCLSTKR